MTDGMHLERIGEVVAHEHCLVCGYEVCTCKAPLPTMPPLTTEETTLAHNATTFAHPSMALTLAYYHWCMARLALAQWIAEEAIREGQQLTLASVGKGSDV